MLVIISDIKRNFPIAHYAYRFLVFNLFVTPASPHDCSHHWVFTCFVKVRARTPGVVVNFRNAILGGSRNPKKNLKWKKNYNQWVPKAYNYHC